LGDCSGMAKLMVEFATNEDEQALMRQRARNVAADYSPAAAVTGTIEALNGLTKSK